MVEIQDSSRAILKMDILWRLDFSPDTRSLSSRLTGNIGRSSCQGGGAEADSACSLLMAACNLPEDSNVVPLLDLPHTLDLNLMFLVRVLVLGSVLPKGPTTQLQAIYLKP